MIDPVTLIGFDFGMRHIGVAVGQTITGSATPQHSLSAQDGIPHWQEITSLIKKWSANGLVVGDPRNMDGTDQAIRFAAHNFAARLKEKFCLPVYLVDERLTTKAARSQLAEHKLSANVSVDSHAAKLILEDWLRDKGKHATPL